MNAGAILRHAVGLALAATALALLAAGLGFLVAGATLPTGAAVQATTLRIGLAALAAFLVFALSFGAAAAAILPRLGRTDARARAAAGAAAGHLFALATLATTPPPPAAWQPAALTLFLVLVGAALLPLAGWIAGALGPRGPDRTEVR